MLLSDQPNLIAMSSCSFRISRTAEDLAQTINALSQRLIKMEQRLEVLELCSKDQPIEVGIEETQILDGVDKLLEECKEILSSSDNKDDIESDVGWETIETIDQRAA